MVVSTSEGPSADLYCQLMRHVTPTYGTPEGTRSGTKRDQLRQDSELTFVLTRDSDLTISGS